MQIVSMPEKIFAALLIVLYLYLVVRVLAKR